MHKKHTLLLIALLISSIGWTQGRMDNWALGYHEKHYEDQRYSVVMNMVTGEVDSLPNSINFESTMAVISDEDGQLLMYTNGCDIYNARHEVMQNGDGLNTGDVHELACDDYGYLLPDGAMFLPDPGDEKKYYLLHLKAINDPIYRIIADQLLYSVIDIGGNNQQGEVLSKNTTMGNFKPESFAVTRHGNGRDWWIVVPERMTNRYYTYLIDPEGIQFIQTQEKGFSYVKDKCNYTGNTMFSPDGSKMARTTAHCGMMIMDFDRCTGTFSIPIHLPEVYTDYKHIHAAFSPDSKSIYIIHGGRVEKYRFFERQLIRLDLDKLGVARDPFYRQRLPHGVAPERIIEAWDGKMIISETNSKPYFHIISSADEKGDTIYLEPQAISYKPLNARTFPNYPNYYLGRLNNSLCDTITAIEDISIQRNIQISPNPIKDVAYISLKNAYKFVLIEIINIEGKILFKEKYESPRSTIVLDFDQYLTGHYIIKVTAGDEEFFYKLEKL